jgi:uncharacterized protein (TIGR01777 family)
MKTIGITGGTGFVGSHLTDLLVSKGYNVVIFTTRVAKRPAKPNVSYAHWSPEKGVFDINGLKEVNAVVHLGGAALADKRWTSQRKKEILDSRVKATDFLISQLREYAPQCTTLITASATGYYGPDKPGAGPFTEDAPAYNDFLGDVCRQWEAASLKAGEYYRTAIFRLGIVLGKESGAFHEFEWPMSFGIMPILGSGKQMVSWIEVNDLARLLLYALEHDQVSGIYNAVAPNHITHRQLMKTIASVKGGIKIPAPVPSFFLKLMVGEMSTEVLCSRTVSAEKVLRAGFTFDHPEITGAVKAILKK